SKNWWTAYGRLAPSTNVPKVRVNCDQLTTFTAWSYGPSAVTPTNAAIAVPTPWIGRGPDATSCTYTPGDRMLLSVAMARPLLVRGARTLRSAPGPASDAAGARGSAGGASVGDVPAAPTGRGVPE